MQLAATSDRLTGSDESFLRFTRPSADLLSKQENLRDDVLEEVRTVLTRYGRLGFRRIDITGEGGRLVLSGTVRSWFEKQLAQHLAMQVPGVPRIVNTLVVEVSRAREA